MSYIYPSQAAGPSINITPVQSLPPELVSQILTELWATPQTVNERSELFRVICSVNRKWLGLFVRVALRHVHLPCALDADAFLRILQDRTHCKGQDDFFTETASQVANNICRSITFHVDGRIPLATIDNQPAIKIYSMDDAASNAVSQVLYMLTALEHLPNLRQVSLHYVDWGYEDLFEQLRSAELPPQVTHLSIEYAYSDRALLPLAVYLKSLYIPQGCPRVTAPGIRHLSLSGVPMEVVSDMLQVCPNVEKLDLTSPTRLYVLAPMPPSVHTLILNHPGAMIDREEMYWWTLSVAMERGLFSCTTKPQVVIRSGTPDPAAFLDLKRHCKRYGVELSFERADVCID